MTATVDIADIRRRNLQALIGALPDEYPDRAALARKLGVSYAQLNQIIGRTPTRGLGEKLARKWEERLGLIRGWLDHDHPEPWATPAFEVREGAPAALTNGHIDIPVYDIRGGMGRGALVPERESVIDSIRVPMSFVRENFPTVSSPTNLRVITGYGDSMKPTFAHGDPLIVDTGVNEMLIDSVYVFTLHDELYVKRIQRLPGGSLKIISDNREMYDPITLPAEERGAIIVHARVVIAWNMRKL